MPLDRTSVCGIEAVLPSVSHNRAALRSPAIAGTLPRRLACQQHALVLLAVAHFPNAVSSCFAGTPPWLFQRISISYYSFEQACTQKWVHTLQNRGNHTVRVWLHLGNRYTLHAEHLMRHKYEGSCTTCRHAPGMPRLCPYTLFSNQPVQHPALFLNHRHTL